MNDEELFQLAARAGFTWAAMLNCKGALREFAQIVAAAEREACAVAGAHAMEDMGHKVGGKMFADGQVIADAIRARGAK